MNERNPERDWAVIQARLAVLDAEEALARKPSAYYALDLQAKQKSWKRLTQLILVSDNGKLRRHD